MLTTQQVNDFQQQVLDYYFEHQRNLPWRQPESDGTFDEYKIMVSEIMLQQTQVPRVIQKYQQFLEAFPTVERLAQASLSEVLVVWQGLGYNRRGRFLRETAISIVGSYDSKVPQTLEQLTALPGIGHNTAAAILVYAHNMPLVFIETNIRTVYLHHFFKDSEAVDDRHIIELVTQTIDKENPREWYWALMDYGSFLKKQHGNPNTRSKQYSKQSVFQGSKRQLRGMILRELAGGQLSQQTLEERINDSRFEDVITGLIKDKMVRRSGDKLQIAD